LHPDEAEAFKQAIAILKHPNGDTPVEGYIEFQQTDAKGPVSIRGTITNLDPDSKRGFHIQ
jgi:Cu-Zn family superoxide dismutase